MLLTSKRLFSKDQTGREMHRLIDRYSSDLRDIYVRKGSALIPFSRLPVNEVFDIVRRLPYRRDVKPVEVIARPREILRNAMLGMDCKKKAIVLASWAKERGIPYRLIASSRKRNRRIHHVFPQLVIGGQPMNFDATYARNRPFEQKYLTKVEVLK